MESEGHVWGKPGPEWGKPGPEWGIPHQGCAVLVCSLGFGAPSHLKLAHFNQFDIPKVTYLLRSLVLHGNKSCIFLTNCSLVVLSDKLFFWNKSICGQSHMNLTMCTCAYLGLGLFIIPWLLSICMCMCVCVCMYVCVYVCMYVHLYFVVCGCGCLCSSILYLCVCGVCTVR